MEEIEGDILCEKRFNEPDPHTPDYSIIEHYYYVCCQNKYTDDPITGIRTLTHPAHRLTLRKNLRTGMFEVFRAFPIDSPFAEDGTKPPDEIVFAGSFAKALMVASDETNKAIHSRLPSARRYKADIPCQHSGKIIDFKCPDIMKRKEEEDEEYEKSE